jgi:hypothetical protein
MQECGYESGNSDNETLSVYIPPKTRRKKFRKTRSNQLMLKQLINKTKKLNLATKFTN